MEFVTEIPADDPKQGKYERELAPLLKNPGVWGFVGVLTNNVFNSIKSGNVTLPGKRPNTDFEFKKVRKAELEKGHVEVYARFVGK